MGGARLERGCESAPAESDCASAAWHYGSARLGNDRGVSAIVDVLDAPADEDENGVRDARDGEERAVRTGEVESSAMIERS